MGTDRQTNLYAYSVARMTTDIHDSISPNLTWNVQ